MKCCVCGREVINDNSVVCCGLFGAITNRYCKECATDMLEPYEQMVDYIACAGHFPNDINEIYQKTVRYILRKIGKTETQFIEDVDKVIYEYEKDFNKWSGKINNNIFLDSPNGIRYHNIQQ